MVPGPVAGVAEKTVERWLKVNDAQRDDLAGMFVEPPSSAEDADTDELGGTGLDVRRVTTVAGERLYGCPTNRPACRGCAGGVARRWHGYGPVDR